MNKLLSTFILVIVSLSHAATDYATLIIYNETGSPALIKLPDAYDFQKFGIHDQLTLWQLDPMSDEPVMIKFKNDADYNLMNRTFYIKPGGTTKWGELPDGRIELQRNNTTPLSASLLYQDADNNWQIMELEVS